MPFATSAVFTILGIDTKQKTDKKLNVNSFRNLNLHAERWNINNNNIQVPSFDVSSDSRLLSVRSAVNTSIAQQLREMCDQFQVDEFDQAMRNIEKREKYSIWLRIFAILSRCCDMGIF